MESRRKKVVITADWGENTKHLKKTAKAMAEQNPEMVLSLGDHFYEKGVDSVEDPHWEGTWRGVFIDPHPELRVPWYCVLGNHDYMSNYQAQIDYTTSELNIGNYWHLPSENYVKSLKPEFDVDMFFLDTN